MKAIFPGLRGLVTAATAHKLAAHKQTGRVSLKSSQAHVDSCRSLCLGVIYHSTFLSHTGSPSLSLFLFPCHSFSPLSINPCPSCGPVKKEKSHCVPETTLSQTDCRACLKEPLSLSLFLFGVTWTAGAGLV